MEIHTSDPEVSVIVPAFNAADTLGSLVADLVEVLGGACSGNFQLLVVDDGSSDDTWGVIRKLAATDQRVRGVRLSKNFGQTPALCAGISYATAPVVATIDADFDTFPQDLVLLVDAVRNGADLANGVRLRRDWRRGVPSRIFNRRLRRLGLGLSDVGCGMIAMTREVALEAAEHGELRRGFRFKVLLAGIAERVDEVPVRAGPHSSSSHRLSELLSGAAEAELAIRRTAFLGLAWVGVVVGATGALVAIAAACWSLFSGGSAKWGLAGWGAIAGLQGLLIAMVGMAANLVLRGVQSQGTPFYRVKVTTGPDGHS